MEHACDMISRFVAPNVGVRNESSLSGRHSDLAITWEGTVVRRKSTREGRSAAFSPRDKDENSYYLITWAVVGKREKNLLRDPGNELRLGRECADNKWDERKSFSLYNFFFFFFYPPADGEK